MKRAFAVVCLCSFLVGCGAQAGGKHSHDPQTISVERPYAGAYPIKAVCTTGMVADLVRQVGGDKVVVEQLMGADVDPHLYKATTGDVAKLGGADVIFYSGLHLEGKMGEIFERMAKKRPTFAVAEYLDPKSILHDDEKANDPHVWFDVSLWSQAVGVVRDALVALDPPHAAEYKARADQYQSQLAALHEEVKGKIRSIPERQRVMITCHDAFQYFGNAYGMEVRAIQGISTDSEASLKEITELVALISERKIKAVFVESSVNDRYMKALIQGCAARGHKVVIGGELFSDAMGEAGTPKGTYIGMIRHNVETLVNALK